MQQELFIKCVKNYQDLAKTALQGQAAGLDSGIHVGQIRLLNDLFWSNVLTEVGKKALDLYVLEGKLDNFYGKTPEDLYKYMYEHGYLLNKVPENSFGTVEKIT